MAAATQRIIIHADDKTGAAIASAVRNTRKLDNQMKRTGDNFRNTTRQSRAHLGQLGHQVQDVAVQLQMGMNPLMVFGQQGSQVASIFGAKGALLGGLIAVAAVLAQQLIPNLFKSTKSIKDLKEEINALNEVVKISDEGVVTLAKSYTMLAERSVQGAIVEAKAEMLALASTIQTAQDATIGLFDAFSGTTMLQRALSDFSDITDQITSARAQFGSYTEELLLNSDAHGSAAFKYRSAAEALKMLSSEMGITFSESLKLSEAIAKAVDGNELEDFISLQNLLDQMASQTGASDEIVKLADSVRDISDPMSRNIELQKQLESILEDLKDGALDTAESFEELGDKGRESAGKVRGLAEAMRTLAPFIKQTTTPLEIFNRQMKDLDKTLREMQSAVLKTA